MKRLRSTYRLLLLVLLGPGCGSDGQGPGPSPDPVGDASRVVIGSAPIDAALLPPLPAAMAGTGSVAFVAAPVGSLADVSTASVTNLRTGVRVSVEVVDRGFDPVPIAVEEGDSLVVSTGPTGGSGTAVRRGTPVRVVRTTPSPTQTDVPLNIRVQVVFSAPIDAASLAGRVTLRRAGATVAGSLAPADANGTMVEFVPASALESQTAYELEVNAGVTDVAGNALPAPVTITFTSGLPEPPVPQDNLVLLAYGPAGQAQLVALDGSEARPVGPPGARDLAWSPDGRWIAFVIDDLLRQPGASFQGGRADVYLMATDGTVHRRLTVDGNNWRPRWRPDGQVIVFEKQGRVRPSPGTSHPGVIASYSIDVGGTNRRRLGAHAPEAWSPDGTRICWQDNEGVWVGTAEGDDAVLVAPGGYAATWGPREGLIAYAVEEEGLFIVAPDGTGRRQLAQSFGWVLPPVWSPDGARLLYRDAEFFGAGSGWWASLDGPATRATGLLDQYHVVGWRR